MTGYTKETTTTTRIPGNFSSVAGASAITNEPTVVMTDVVTGGVVHGNTNRFWRKQIRLHSDATTDLDATETSVECQSGYFYSIRKTKSTGLDDRWFKAAGAPYGGPVTVPPLGGVSTSRAESTAAGDFYSAARNKMSTFKGSVFAAEAREAQKMMVDRGRKMIAMIDPYQRRLKRRWYGKGSKRSRLKLLSDSYLELQFGWVPLISDIKDAYKALQNPRPQYSRVFGEGMTEQRIGPVFTPYSVGIGQGTVETTQTENAYVRYYGEVRAYKEPSGAGGLQDFGLHAREFLPTVYEVIPWSFAVDYFTNVNQIVNAVAYCGANFTWRAKVIVTERVYSRTMHFEPQPSNAVYDYRVERSSPFRSVGRAKTIARRRDVVVEIPSLQWHLPKLGQAINLAALAVSRRLRLFHV